MSTCNECGSSYKNRASLTAHKHRYHPYLRKSVKSDDETSSVKSDVSSLRTCPDIDLKMEVADIKQVMKSLDCTFGHLAKRVDDLEFNKSHSQRVTKEMVKQELDSIDNNNKITRNFDKLKFQIKSLKRQMREMKQSSHVQGDLETDEDIFNEMVEIPNLFIGRDFEALNGNIKGLKLGVTLLLSAEIGTDMLSYDELTLLEEISRSSKPIIKILLKKNFSNLVNIFTKLKPAFDKIQQENEDDKADDEEGSSEEESFGQETENERCEDTPIETEESEE